MAKTSWIKFDEMEDQAVRLLDGGKLRRAERVLRQMLAIEPKCPAAHFQLARVYLKIGSYKLALRHARRTLKLNPNERNASLNLGLIYDVMGDEKLASTYYNRELILNPHSPETLWNLGRLYFRRHSWLKASKCLQRCFSMGYMFDIEDTVYWLTACYSKLDDLDAYIKILVQYVQMFPDAAWAFANLGRALLEVKDYEGKLLPQPSKAVDAAQVGLSGVPWLPGVPEWLSTVSDTASDATENYENGQGPVDSIENAAAKTVIDATANKVAE